MEDPTVFDIEGLDIAWCPGCGNFGILAALKQALTTLTVKPENLVIVSGIGQAAKTPHYLRCNVFHGLHGRTLPVATAVKAANPGLTVIAEGGDGDMYAEGGNHFLHAIRRNPNITNIVHNNMVYGLTKGQASPTSRKGFTTPVQVDGVFLEPFNPAAVAIALNASFVARAFAGDVKQTGEILNSAIAHKGYALVDVLQPCTSFNRVQTHQWLKEHTYYLEDSYDPSDRIEAFRQAVEGEKMVLGILYRSADRPTFEDNLGVYKDDKTPLCERVFDGEKLKEMLDARRRS
jgi:2-oxoglutarate ferredoxin oxidoreductase subunit beta